MQSNAIELIIFVKKLASEGPQILKPRNIFSRIEWTFHVVTFTN